MNLPPEQASGRFYQASMGALLPALKVIAQVEIRNGSLDVALLDLAHRRVSFEQAGVRNLDWPQLRSALAERRFVHGLLFQINQMWSHGITEARMKSHEGSCRLKQGHIGIDNLC